MAQQAAQLISRQGEETRSAVERIAAFTVVARPEQLKPNVQQLFKRNILDSIACAIAALPGPPFKALREQFEEYRAPGRCTLIGGGKTSVDQAALFNSGLTHYVDLLDSYMAPGGLAHPSDNFGSVLAAAEHAGKEHIGYEGGLDQPMSWDRVVEKFHWLSERYADGNLRSKLINTVQQLDSQPLMDLLGQVRPMAVYPKTRAGI